jgi:hypothetical protein
MKKAIPNASIDIKDSKDSKVSHAGSAMFYVIVATTLLTYLFLGCMCQAQSSRYRIGPLHNPELYHEPCDVTLGRIKGRMLEVTRKEIEYNEGKNKVVRFYQGRITTVMTTHDLVPSVFTCTTGSIRDLNYILAKWELDWVQERYGLMP